MQVEEGQIFQDNHKKKKWMVGKQKHTVYYTLELFSLDSYHDAQTQYL